MAFDHRVHVRDPKSGRVTASNPYRFHVGKDGAYYERGGVFFYPDGTVKETVVAPAAIAPVDSAPAPMPVKAKEEKRIPTGHVQLD